MANEIGRRNNPDVSIQRMNKLTYKVKSQSDPSKWYLVVKEYARTFGDKHDGKWSCRCPDYTFRHIECKHIHAVIFSKLLRKKVYKDVLLGLSPNQQVINEAIDLGKIVCQKCGSSNYEKSGVRHNKKAGDIQRYLCHDCGFRFTSNPAFENSKASAKAITVAVDLYFKGVSLRKIADHLKQSYGTDINYSSVCRWIRKFSNVVKPYVDGLVPANVSGVYHADEMMLHVRKENNDPEGKPDYLRHKFFNDHYSWLWNVMDNSTRFWICSMVCQKRDSETGVKLMKEMKRVAPLPKAIVHDGLPTYDDVYKKELLTLKNPRIMNIRSIGSNEDGLNPKVERLNGTVRDRECVMRGMDTAKSAQELIDAMRIHYNFLRVNQSIEKTPAEAAGINLNLGEQNKVENLMRLAAIKQKNAQIEPFVTELGIRAQKVQILNEKDCIKAKPREWMDKKNWREISEILRKFGFSWLSNGKDSCWIKMTSK